MVLACHWYPFQFIGYYYIDIGIIRSAILLRRYLHSYLLANLTQIEVSTSVQCVCNVFSYSVPVLN